MHREYYVIRDANLDFQPLDIWIFYSETLQPQHPPSWAFYKAASGFAKGCFNQYVTTESPISF